MSRCAGCGLAVVSLVEGSTGLFEVRCTLTGQLSGERCDRFVPREGGFVDPRGETYSQAHFERMAGRSLCRKVLGGTHHAFLMGLRKRRGEEAVAQLEQRAREEWKIRQTWMTEDELRRSRHA